MVKCAIIPTVRNKENQVVDSKLFKDLLSTIGNRPDAKNIYLITKNTEFQKKWDSVLSKDENGEYTINSLFEKTEMSSVLGDGKVLETLNKQLGNIRGNKTVSLTPVSLEEMSRKAVEFNQRTPLKNSYAATVVKSVDEKGNPTIGLTAKKRTPQVNKETNDMATNLSLNNKLRSILAEKGVSVGALTELERRRGINGVTDFSKAKDASNGILELIRIADGVRGEQALPEEFAHFAIEALGNNPLVNRLINLLDSKNLTQEILGEDFNTYNSLYEGNKAKLAKEAAGKLVAKHLLQQQEIPQTNYRSLLSRVIDSIKSFFKSLSGSAIQKAMVEADAEYGEFAKQLLTGQLSKQMKVSNISTSDLFYSTKERISRDKKIVEALRDNELKRLKIYEKRNPNSKFTTNQRLLIDKLDLSLLNNNEIVGIYDFLEQALDDLTKVETRLNLMMGTSASNLNDRAKTLRDVRNYIYSYSNMLGVIREANREEQRLEDNRYGERVKIALAQVSELISNLETDYKEVALPLFADFIKPFFGENMVIPFGKDKGKVLKVEDLLTHADRDITVFDRWLDSMADSSDYMLKVMDQAVKKSKETARLDTIDLIKQVQAIAMKFEQQGIKDTNWMYERDSKGNLTGNYITEINHGLFKEAMSKMFKDLNQKYGKKPVGEDLIKVEEEKRKWFANNMTTNEEGKRVPIKSKYGSKEFAKLSSIQKNFYNEMMAIKEQLDSYLPEGATTSNNAIKIRKDLLERVKGTKGLGGKGRQIWEDMKDLVVRRTDDTDFETKSTLMDFEGRAVETLPIYYTSMIKGESANDMSLDFVSTLIAYGAMANDFKEMNKVIDVLEIGRDILLERTVQDTAGKKPYIERFNSMGRTVESKLNKRPEDTQTKGRLNDFFTMQVYGKYMKDEGTIGDTDVDWGKLANLLNRVTSMNNLALNALSGLSNIATGKVMMRIESFAGEFFNERDTLRADTIYAREMPKFMGEIGNRVKVSKLHLFDELFNVMQEYEQDVRDVNYDRKTWFGRMFNSSALFTINNAGEHWMQNRTALALASAYKMKDPKGKIVNLWDALEVNYINPTNKSLGAKLVVRKGYTKMDGSEFSKDDIMKFSRKSAGINQRMHGIYNKLDRSAIQRLALGRLGMMFRKWMKPSLNRRFKSATYNFDLDAWTEGYYVSAFGFMKAVAKDLIKLQFTFTTQFKKLHTTEQANIRRAFTELGHLFGIILALGALGKYYDDEDPKDRSWSSNMLEYQLRRLYTEIGALSPTPAMVNEGLRLLKSPAASINTAERFLDLIALLNWNNYEFIVGDDAIIKSGAYKGKSKAMQKFLRSPMFPMYNTAMRTIHVGDQIPFFKQ